MKFDVYCDESYPDLLSSKKPKATFLLIGSIWLKTENRQEIKEAIHGLRNKHRVGSEFKWRKVSPSRMDFYKELIDLFVGMGEDLRYRCILVKHEEVDLKLYHNDDQELGFYKFYYQMLHHWIDDFNEYSVFVDFKKNRSRDRTHVLEQCLGYANLSSKVTVQPIPSKESVLIQLADLLTGAASYRLNDKVEAGSAKAQLIEHLESKIGKPITATSLSEKKFNVFKINLQGGW